MPRRPTKFVPALLWRALVVAVAGCASSSKTYGPDGREFHVLNCSGWARSWSMCLERAGEICGPNGYDVLERGGAPSGYLISGASATPLISREMAIACHPPM